MRQISTFKSALLCAGLALLAAAPAGHAQGNGSMQRDPYAQAGGSPGQGGQGSGAQGGQHPHRPPQQAIAACQGKASGAVCNFTGMQNQTLAGTCFAPPGGAGGGAAGGNANAQSGPPLACRPAGAPGMGQGMGQGNGSNQSFMPKG